MEFNLIIIVLIAIVSIFLIFKLIKKVIVAIISAVLVVLLLFGGVIGLAVYDVKTLSEKSDFTVEVIYLDNDNYLLGTEFLVENSSLNLEEINYISESNYDETQIKELSNNDDKFVITLQKEVFMDFLTLETYNFDFLEIEGLPEGTITELTKEEVIFLIESETAIDDLLDILFKKNNISELIAIALKPALKSKIETKLEELGITMNQAIFLGAVRYSLDNGGLDYVSLFESYKDDTTSIYPDRFSFSLVRMLPVGFLSNFVENSIISSN